MQLVNIGNEFINPDHIVAISPTDKPGYCVMRMSDGKTEFHFNVPVTEMIQLLTDLGVDFSRIG